MVALGVVAFDGTRIAANASVDANRTETHLRRLATEFVDTVASNDQADDTLFGEDNRGDELPAQVGDRSHREERIGQALEEIQQRRRATERSRQEQAERGRAYEQAMATDPAAPKGGVPKSADPVAVAKARWERRRADAQARYTRLLELAKQRRRGAPPPVPPDQLAAVRKGPRRLRRRPRPGRRDPGQGSPGPGGRADRPRRSGAGRHPRPRPPASPPPASRTRSPRTSPTRSRGC
jgi:hypothetical protein